MNNTSDAIMNALITFFRRYPSVRVPVVIVSATLVIIFALGTAAQLVGFLRLEVSNAFVGTVLALFALLSFTFLAAALLAYLPEKEVNPRGTLQERLAEAESKVVAEPEKARAAWDVARITLEDYFNRNLSQSNYIFWFSVGVMFLGFIIIAWGVTQAMFQPGVALPAIVAAAAGVLTEFIGATFLFVYRSTLTQSAAYARTLERMNVVGMAVQIMEGIPDGAKQEDVRAATKGRMVEILVKHAYEGSNAGEPKKDDK